MSVTLVGSITILWTLACILKRNATWVGYLLAGTMPFVTSSAIVFGDNKIQPFFVAAFAAPAVLLLSSQSRTPWRLGAAPALTLVYCAAGAVFLPVIFRGRFVLSPRGGIDEQAVNPSILEPSISNFAQLAYLVLAVLVVALFVRFRIDADVLTFGFAVGSVFNLWAFVGQFAHMYYPAVIFDSAIYGEKFVSVVNGHERFRGIYSEPSLLGVFSLAAVIYCVFAIVAERQHRIVLMSIIGLNLIFLLASYSGTVLVGGGLAVLVVACKSAWGFLFKGRAIRRPVFITAVVFLLLAVVVTPSILNFASNLISQKINSDSFNNRFASDVFSLRLLYETGGLGVGIGSNRPSSFATSMASTIGLPGVFLLAVIVVKVLQAAFRSGRLPEMWAFMAVLLAKVVSEPNPNQPLFWMTLAAAAAALGCGGHAPIPDYGHVLTQRLQPGTTLLAVSSASHSQNESYMNGPMQYAKPLHSMAGLLTARLNDGRTRATDYDAR